MLLALQREYLVSRFLLLLLFYSTCLAMPKLYFRHGAVSSAKTLNLLAVAHNYKTQGKNVILMKVNASTLDTWLILTRCWVCLSACTGRSLG
jgi:hypothetical protein